MCLHNIRVHYHEIFSDYPYVFMYVDNTKYYLHILVLVLFSSKLVINLFILLLTQNAHKLAFMKTAFRLIFYFVNVHNVDCKIVKFLVIS